MQAFAEARLGYAGEGLESDAPRCRGNWRARSGVAPQPNAAATQASLAACRARQGGPQAVPMHAMALLFARNAGVEPDRTVGRSCAAH
jgi:hypothetical protein